MLSLHSDPDRTDQPERQRGTSVKEHVFSLLLGWTRSQARQGEQLCRDEVAPL